MRAHKCCAPVDAKAKLVAAGMTSKDGQLVGPNGQPLFFHGINWCALLSSVLFRAAL